ncbi:MAG: hypothetical protein WC614_13145 [bacterium]
MTSFHAQFLQELKKIKEEILYSIRLDKAIDCDNYEDVARLKVYEKIEKAYLKLQQGGNNGNNSNNHR